jgi:hypothetical protein
MKMRWPLLLSLALISGSAQAQSALDKYLKKNTESGSGKSNAEEAGINKVFKSPEGYWRLDDSRATGGFCAITYVTPAYLAGYLGPVGNTTDAFMVFNGPTIPAIKKEKRKQMTITGADGLSQTTQAVHAPNSKDMGAIYFRLTGIQAAMDEMSDVEHVTIGMDKKQVFSLKWKGGHTARAALNKCLASTPSAGAKQ